MQPNEGFLKKFYPVILVTVVVLVSAVSLSFVNRFASVKIKAQQDAAALVPLKGFFPDMTDYRLENDIYVMLANEKPVGYAFKAVGTGYHGDISIMVALEDAATVKGIAVIAQSETAGLGTRVTLPSFTDKFIGKKIESIKLRTEGGQIDGISGSTISSRAVIDTGRNTALEKIKTLPK